MKIRELKKAIDPILTLKLAYYHPLVQKLLTFYQGVSSGLDVHDADTELTPEQFFELTKIVLDIRTITNQRSTKTDKNMQLLIEQTAYIFDAMRYVLYCDNEFIELREKGKLTLDLFTEITKLILSPNVVSIIDHCRMPASMANFLFQLAKQKLLTSERIEKISDFVLNKNGFFETITQYRYLPRFLQKLESLNIRLTKNDLDFLISDKSYLFFQTWNQYPNDNRLDKILLNHLAAIIAHSDPVKVLSCVHRVYRTNVSNYDFAPELHLQLANEVLSLPEPWSALNVFIEMNIVPDIFTPENRALIISSKRADLLALNNALDMLNEAKLLNKLTFDAINSHAKPLQLAEAFSFLYKNEKMYTTKNMMRAAKHLYPLEFVYALKTLSANNLNKHVYRSALSKSSCPDKFAHAICYLHKKIELSADELSMLAKKTDPHATATWLVKLQSQGILTPEKREKLLASSNPKKIANKFLCNNYATDKSSPFSSQSVLFKPEKKRKAKVEPQAQTFSLS